MSKISTDTLLWNILNEFEYIALQQVCNIAFLIEHQFFIKHNTRLTNTSYTEYLSGVHSEEIEDIIRYNNRLEIDRTRINNETVKMVVNPITQLQSVDSDVQQICETIISEYGERNPSVINKQIKSIIPKDSNITEEIDFNKLHEK